MLGVLTGGIATAVIFVVQHWNQIKGAFSAVGDWIKNAWNGVINFFWSSGGNIWNIFHNIAQAIGTIFNDVWTAIGNTFKAMINWIIGKLNDVIHGANDVVSVMSLGSASIPDIPKLANGGVVMPRAGGTLVRVAEAGQAEAVIPLNRLSSMTGGGQGGGSITINVATLPGNEQATAREIKRLLAKAARTSGNAAAMTIFSGAW